MPKVRFINSKVLFTPNNKVAMSENCCCPTDCADDKASLPSTLIATISYSDAQQYDPIEDEYSSGGVQWWRKFTQATSTWSSCLTQPYEVVLNKDTGWWRGRTGYSGDWVHDDGDANDPSLYRWHQYNDNPTCPTPVQMDYALYLTYEHCYGVAADSETIQRRCVFGKVKGTTYVTGTKIISKVDFPMVFTFNFPDSPGMWADYEVSIDVP